MLHHPPSCSVQKEPSVQTTLTWPLCPLTAICLSLVMPKKEQEISVFWWLSLSTQSHGFCPAAFPRATALAFLVTSLSYGPTGQGVLTTTGVLQQPLLVSLDSVQTDVVPSLNTLQLPLWVWLADKWKHEENSFYLDKMQNPVSFKTATGHCYPVLANGTLWAFRFHIVRTSIFFKVSKKYYFYVKFLVLKYWLKYFLKTPQAKQNIYEGWVQFKGHWFGP